MGRLDSKVAIITGAGSGIGRASALLFAKEGAKIVVADYSAEGGEATVKMVQEAGGEAAFVKTDVSKPEDIENMVKVTVFTFGKLDILFACAGLTVTYTPVADCPIDDFDKDIAINLKGSFLSMRYAIPAMIENGGGSIIAMSSLAGTKAIPNMCGYVAAKGGVASLTRAAAVEYANENIRANSLAPGVVWTASWQALAKKSPESYDIFMKTIPQCRPGLPEEIASVALFLASDESSHVTGQMIGVDGGMEANSCAKVVI